MSMDRRSRWLRRGARLIVVAALLAGTASFGSADVRTSTQYRSYSVSGSTSRSLVSYMRSRPLRGDHGNAVANIRPTYKISAPTKMVGGKCRAPKVTLHIRFVMTLPRARSESAMASSTRNAWRSFVSFSKRHEQTHRNIYIQCGNTFVAKAQKMSSKSCAGLQSAIRRQLEAEKAACERKHRAFDRRESSRIRNLSLFRMAR
jgi:predicted secreted Zn-dependent protease